MTFYLPIVLMILGTTFYHIAQKSVPPQINPVFSLMLNYMSALAGTAVLIPIYLRSAGEPWSMKNTNWASCGVGFSIVAVELGVLLAYRAGWKISLVSVVGNTATSLLLVMIGLVFFHEHLSAKSLAGVALCLLGLTLVTGH